MIKVIWTINICMILELLFWYFAHLQDQIKLGEIQDNKHFILQVFEESLLRFIILKKWGRTNEHFIYLKKRISVNQEFN